jgi:hypothetical protein
LRERHSAGPVDQQFVKGAAEDAPDGPFPASAVVEGIAGYEGEARTSPAVRDGAVKIGPVGVCLDAEHPVAWGLPAATDLTADRSGIRAEGIEVNTVGNRRLRANPGRRGTPRPWRTDTAQP